MTSLFSYSNFSTSTSSKWPNLNKFHKVDDMYKLQIKKRCDKCHHIRELPIVSRQPVPVYIFSGSSTSAIPLIDWHCNRKGDVAHASCNYVCSTRTTIILINATPTMEVKSCRTCLTGHTGFNWHDSYLP